MTVFDAIKNRTSYRRAYKNTKIPREDLTKIMEAGLSAPSGCNKQTTSLIAVDVRAYCADCMKLFNHSLPKLRQL